MGAVWVTVSCHYSTTIGPLLVSGFCNGIRATGTRFPK